jgi:hypothetical protein
LLGTFAVSPFASVALVVASGKAATFKGCSVVAVALSRGAEGPSFELSGVGVTSVASVDDAVAASPTLAPGGAAAGDAGLASTGAGSGGVRAAFAGT